MKILFNTQVTAFVRVVVCLLWAAGCSTDRTASSGLEGVGVSSKAGAGGAIGAGQPMAMPAGSGAAGTAAVGGAGGALNSGTAGTISTGGAAGSHNPSSAGVGGGSGSGGASGSTGAAGSGGGSGSSGAAGSGNASGTSGAGGKSSTASGAGSVGAHGALHVMGNRVVDASGKPLQLRGMSLFWSQWSDYDTAGSVDQLVDDWHATLIRVPLGIAESGGYLSSPADNEAKITTVVDRAIARGAYAVIDWHDDKAPDHQSAAIDFFTRMAKKYSNSPGVLFEIYNEPTGVEWPAVRAYAQAVIAAIRGAGATNLVIVGTPNWSQDVDVAAQSPITGYADIAYTLHFYAATHKQPLRDKAKTALDAGLALFVTEWGTCESSGDGTVDPAETKTWLDFLDQDQISWANWSLNNKAESCSALTPSAGTTGPWTGSALTTSGTLVKALIP
jgi:endoglucanase